MKLSFGFFLALATIVIAVSEAGMMRDIRGNVNFTPSWGKRSYGSNLVDMVDQEVCSAKGMYLEQLVQALKVSLLHSTYIGTC